MSYPGICWSAQGSWRHHGGHHGAVYLDSKGDFEICWLYFAKFSNTWQRSSRKSQEIWWNFFYEKFPEAVQFDKPQVLANGIVNLAVVIEVRPDLVKRFRRISANKTLAKLSASKCALREFKKQQFLSTKWNSKCLTSHKKLLNWKSVGTASE